jgi:heme-NO-binding protein
VHGLIFVSFRDYLASVHGPAIEEKVLDGEPLYLVSEAYADENFTNLIGRACHMTGLEPDALLREFGVFTADKTFARLYPALFDLSPSARAFLLTVERPIHELVRVAMPRALPPELAVSELGESGVAIVYTSPRRMCSLLRGLVEGTAQHYGERVHIEERTCMHQGAGACRFEVRFLGRARPFGKSPRAARPDAASSARV